MTDEQYVVDPVYPRLGGNKPGGDPFSYEESLWRWLNHTFSPQVVLDVGSARGETLVALKHMGITAIGIEGLPANIDACHARDVTAVEWDLERGSLRISGVELVWCCEVVEHVLPDFVENVVDTITVGRVLAMTHAVPGQYGYHHVNCQPPEYWIGLIEQRGLKFSKSHTAEARKQALSNGYFVRTGLVFVRD